MSTPRRPTTLYRNRQTAPAMQPDKPSQCSDGRTIPQQDFCLPRRLTLSSDVFWAKQSMRTGAIPKTLCRGLRAVGHPSARPSHSEEPGDPVQQYDGTALQQSPWVVESAVNYVDSSKLTLQALRLRTIGSMGSSAGGWRQAPDNPIIPYCTHERRGACSVRPCRQASMYRLVSKL